jgi:hypothetical protein
MNGKRIPSDEVRNAIFPPSQKSQFVKEMQTRFKAIMGREQDLDYALYDISFQWVRRKIEP